MDVVLSDSFEYSNNYYFFYYIIRVFPSCQGYFESFLGNSLIIIPWEHGYPKPRKYSKIKRTKGDLHEKSYTLYCHESGWFYR